MFIVGVDGSPVGFEGFDAVCDEGFVGDIKGCVSGFYECVFCLCCKVAADDEFVDFLVISGESGFGWYAYWVYWGVVCGFFTAACGVGSSVL